MTTYYFDGKEISHIEFVSKGISFGVLPAIAPRRCTYWDLLNENAEKGHEKSIEFLKHVSRITK